MTPTTININVGNFNGDCPEIRQNSIVPVQPQPYDQPVRKQKQGNADFWWWTGAFLFSGATFCLAQVPPLPSQTFRQPIPKSAPKSVMAATPSQPLQLKSDTAKVNAALKLTFGFEGGCQNLARDKGNLFQGKIGFTCMGIIPSVGWTHRDGLLAKLGEGFSDHPSQFVKFVHDKDPEQFKIAVSEIYKKDYFIPGGCNELSRPAFEICVDIAVNSGVGRSKQYLKEIGNQPNVKVLAKALNNRHRQDYNKWGAPGKKNHVFFRGWNARANKREEYINQF